MTMGGNKMHNLNTINDGPFYQADALLHDWAIFQLHHGENKLIFNEIMMRSALY
jgi:hypothetical protein